MWYCICTKVLHYFVCNILCGVVSVQQLYSIVSVTSYAVLHLNNILQCSVCITVFMTLSVAQFTFLCLHRKLRYYTCTTVYSPVVFLLW